MKIGEANYNIVCNDIIFENGNLAFNFDKTKFICFWKSKSKQNLQSF